MCSCVAVEITILNATNFSIHFSLLFWKVIHLLGTVAKRNFKYTFHQSCGQPFAWWSSLMMARAAKQQHCWNVTAALIALQNDSFSEMYPVYICEHIHLPHHSVPMPVPMPVSRCSCGRRWSQWSNLSSGRLREFVRAALCSMECRHTSSLMVPTAAAAAKVVHVPVCVA